MRDFVRGDVIEDGWRSKHETPGERQRACGGARAPSAGLVANGEAAGPDTETSGVPSDALLQFGARLTGEPLFESLDGCGQFSRSVQFGKRMPIDATHHAAAR